MTKTDIDALPANRLVPFYLMFSYLYYAQDISPLGDDVYDHLCWSLFARWGEVTHPHRSLVEWEALTSTTGFYIREYPHIVRGAAWGWLVRNRPHLYPAEPPRLDADHWRISRGAA